MRFLLLFCLCLGILTSGYSYSGDERPLDLPSGGAGKDTDEEDAPEAIRFYGSEFEGDCFVFIVPAYGFCERP